MNRLLARTGPWLSVAVSVLGVAAALPVALLTPPLSGGTIAALLMVAAFGSIGLRVIHVKNRQRAAQAAPRPGVWVKVNDELGAKGVSTEDIRRMIAGMDSVLHAEGIR